MLIQKRFIVLQLLMNILFLLLAIFAVVRNVYADSLVLYIGFGTLIVLLILFYIIYKNGDAKMVLINPKLDKINKTNLYVYMIGYLAIVVIGNLENKEMLHIYLIGALICLSAIFGIVIQVKILIKANKNSK